MFPHILTFSLPKPYATLNCEASFQIKKVFMTTVFFKILPLLCLSTFSSGLQAQISENSSWQPRALSVDLAMGKMWKNSKKAIEEHQKKDSDLAYTPLQDSLPSIEAMIEFKPTHPLNFSYVTAEAQGPRKSMEDAHFFKEIKQGVIVGVLDGHGGSEVSQFASGLFCEKFPEAFAQVQGNIHQAFEALIHEIHIEIAAKKEWDHIGTTAVLCFIDKYTHRIYTANLGDSEANIYRKNKEGHFQSIPLSCIRDWSSTKDAKRASIALKNPHIALIWPKVDNPKGLRYPSPFHGINISRCIGDVAFSSAVIHKPKITVNQLQIGDILILACDGLKDYVLESEIIMELHQNGSNENLAKRLVNYAIYIKNSLDNVTILTVNVD